MKPWYHFVGVAGSGMSALAQFHLLTGGRASGSDRAFDQGKSREIRACLEKAGTCIVPQDGRAFLEALPRRADNGAPGPETDAARGPDALVVSTAVEDSVPDIRVARERGIPILHRSELLAEYVKAHRSVAVTGTSGKSTVTAMIFELLRGTGRDPSLLTGGELILLQEWGFLGNAWAGTSDLLVLEADESDGSLIRYQPWLGLLLNLQKDHKEPEELARIFAAFRQRTRGPFVVGEDENLGPFAEGAIRFGFSRACDIRAEDVELRASDSSFTIQGSSFGLPVPGIHNVKNAAAAVAACSACGVPVAEMPPVLRTFRGVARRFQHVGAARGCDVIDDFAHNPEKIKASLSAAHLRDRRILAVFQPHGYGPTRFLRNELVAAFAEGLARSDRLFLLEIFYAGGTAQMDVSSSEIASDIAAHGRLAVAVPNRQDLLDLLEQEVRAGDVILVMGARDPSLTDFCREILGRLDKQEERS